MNRLLKKYNLAAPRYTSYPPVPYWDTVPTPMQWEKKVKNIFVKTNNTEGISLYIHLPFCESLCTYCGCNTRITVNHQVELPYMTAVLSEWSMYLSIMGETPRIRELHLGGGTPTFFSPGHLSQLLKSILSSATLCEDAALSFEGHPDNTTVEHLEALYDLGFTRMSLGIQDFDPVVQTAIHRFQSVEQVREITEKARAIGYTSVNYDLIYGLPHQTEAGIEATFREVVLLRPDRIAFYSYAHVPWIKPGQRSFTEANLPDPSTKQRLYEAGRNAFERAGYKEIGMDHFALPNDELFKAVTNKTLHRNFMGYTPFRTDLLIGLGVSAISDAWSGFVQNEKKLEDYYHRILQNELPFFKGHLLTESDRIIRHHILSLMCRFTTNWENPEDQCDDFQSIIERLSEMEIDGLIELSENKLTITDKGKPFLRTICMAFDIRLREEARSKTVFSQTI
ncbi:MAG: oxygen-independent coproporphyrinogen III oxidase [Bacteroidota bacterium]